MPKTGNRVGKNFINNIIMATHEITDKEGNHHYLNDEEYRQYNNNKNKKGCSFYISCFVFLLIFIAYLFNGNSPKKRSSHKHHDRTEKKVSQTKGNSRTTDYNHSTEKKETE